MRKGVAAIVIVLLSAAIFKTFWGPVKPSLSGRQVSVSGLHIANPGAAKTISEELIPVP